MNTITLHLADEDIVLSLAGICFARYTKSTKTLYVSYGIAFVECTGISPEQWESIRDALARL